MRRINAQDINAGFQLGGGVNHEGRQITPGTIEKVNLIYYKHFPFGILRKY